MLFSAWPAAAAAHQQGWAYYLDRMRRTANGDDVGADRWANRRVPTPQQLRS